VLELRCCSLFGAAVGPGSVLHPALLSGLAGGLAATVLPRLPRKTGDPVLIGAALPAAVMLTAHRDDHGPAVVLGLAVAWLVSTL
jgi:hypothetical protein